MERQKNDHGIVTDRGKRYSLVAHRVETFRRAFGLTLGIETSWEAPLGFDRGAPIIAKCAISDDTGRVVATGHACEWISSSEFTHTSPIEVAETSAVGRALASLGLHGGEYASGDEMQRVPEKARAREEAPNVPRQDAPEPQQEELSGLYFPDGSKTVGEDVDLVIDALNNADSQAQVAKYFSELEDWRQWLEQNEPDLNKEIDQAFAVTHAALTGKR